MSNSNTYVSDETTKHFFGWIIGVLLVYWIVVLATLYTLHKQVDKHEDYEPGTTYWLKITAFQKFFGFAIGILFVAYSGYIWDRFDGSLFTFVIAVLDVCMDVILLVIFLISIMDIKVGDNSNVRHIEIRQAIDNRY